MAWRGVRRVPARLVDVLGQFPYREADWPRAFMATTTGANKPKADTWTSLNPAS
jgi:hypothetical protein